MREMEVDDLDDCSYRDRAELLTFRRRWKRLLEKYKIPNRWSLTVEKGVGDTYRVLGRLTPETSARLRGLSLMDMNGHATLRHEDRPVVRCDVTGAEDEVVTRVSMSREEVKEANRIEGDLRKERAVVRGLLRTSLGAAPASLMDRAKRAGFTEREAESIASMDVGLGNEAA